MSRAGLEPAQRLTLLPLFGSLWGFFLGSYNGGKRSSMQFLAENAHRLPSTVEGWYFYHKTKNYRVLWGGIRSGLRAGWRFGAVCLAFEGIEAALDEYRGSVDVFDSVGAAVITASGVSLLNRLPRQSTKYAIAIGVAVGAISGGAQDLLRWYKGQRVEYIESIQRRLPITRRPS